jgi:NADPH:quinone reductase-like Zn-dependent oxidoreductase
MKAARIHRLGTPDVIVVEEVPRPAPAGGELLIRVAASGVGPWDALIKKARQADTAAHVDQWVSSPGLRPPT